jgi:hypothetical protein
MRIYIIVFIVVALIIGILAPVVYAYVAHAAHRHFDVAKRFPLWTTAVLALLFLNAIGAILVVLSRESDRQFAGLYAMAFLIGGVVGNLLRRNSHRKQHDR